MLRVAAIAAPERAQRQRQYLIATAATEKHPDERPTGSKLWRAALSEGSAWDFDSLTGHIVDYCEEHPEVPLPEAVKDLWAALNAE